MRTDRQSLEGKNFYGDPMSASSIHRSTWCVALSLALDIVVAGSGGIASAAEMSGATIASNANGFNSVAFANEILNRWQPIAEQLGQNSSAWREMFATQFGMMNASVLQRINAVTADTKKAKTSYAPFVQE